MPERKRFVILRRMRECLTSQPNTSARPNRPKHQRCSDPKSIVRVACPLPFRVLVVPSARIRMGTAVAAGRRSAAGTVAMAFGAWIVGGERHRRRSERFLWRQRHRAGACHRSGIGDRTAQHHLGVGYLLLLHQIPTVWRRSLRTAARSHATRRGQDCVARKCRASVSGLSKKIEGIGGIPRHKLAI